MLNLGKIKIDFPVVQAALSGYSDLPMRRLARRFGASYTLNEVVLDKLVTQPGKTRRRLLKVEKDDHPVGGQLMGAVPETFAPAAADLAEAGYDVIDINFGCPVRKVLGRCRGGFLLSTPDTALEIVRRVVDAVGRTHPVTVKMRRGLDDSAESERNFFSILDGAFVAGVSAVTIHGRTVEQRYIGPSQWSFLARVKRHVGDRTVLGSGDLFTAEDCLRMMAETGVDGVTVARGCIGYPWIFNECRSLAAGEALPEIPSVAHQRETVEWHFEETIRVYGEGEATQRMRKFMVKYSEIHPCSIEVRNAFITLRTVEQFRAALDEWYDAAVDWPPAKRPSEPHLIAAGACA